MEVEREEHSYATSFAGRCREVAYSLMEEREIHLPSPTAILIRGIISVPLLALFISTSPRVINYMECWYWFFNHMVTGITVGVFITFISYWVKRYRFRRSFTRLTKIKRANHKRVSSRKGVGRDAVSLVTFTEEDGPYLWDQFIQSECFGIQTPEATNTRFVVNLLISLCINVSLGILFLVLFPENRCEIVAAVLGSGLPLTVLALDRFLMDFRQHPDDVSKKLMPGIPPFYALYEDGLLLVNGQGYKATKLYRAELVSYPPSKDKDNNNKKRDKKNKKDEDGDDKDIETGEKERMLTSSSATSSLSLSLSLSSSSNRSEGLGLAFYKERLLGCLPEELVLTLPVPQGHEDEAEKIIEWLSKEYRLCC